MLRSFLNLGGRLLLICLIAALALSVTYNLTAPVKEANEAAAAQAARLAIYPESKEFVDLTEQELADIRTAVGYQKISAICKTDDGGALVTVTTHGYNDLTLMVGIKPDGHCAGYAVLTSTETSGIGSKVTEEPFMKQFRGAETPVEYGNGVEAISGATLSSRAVREAVNYAAAATKAIGGVQ